MQPDPRINPATCCRCKASVIHAATAGGRRVAVAAEPDTSGDVRLVYRRGDLVPEVRFVPPYERRNYQPSEPWYLEHLCEVTS